MRDFLGLVIRRWRPCLALIAMFVPLGIVLSRLSRHVADASAVRLWLYVNNWEMTHITNSGFRLDLARNVGRISMEYLTLAFYSWIAGVALGFLSRRAIRVNGALFCLVLLFGALLGAPQNRYHSAVFAL